MVEEHSAGTTYILTQGCRDADVNGLFVEKELHAWNEEFRTKKDRANSRQTANHRSLGHDLDSILSDIVEKDALILEVSVGGRRRPAMPLDLLTTPRLSLLTILDVWWSRERHSMGRRVFGTNPSYSRCKSRFLNDRGIRPARPQLALQHPWTCGYEMLIRGLDTEACA